MTPEARRIAHRALELFGAAVEPDAATVHVLALWKDPSGPLRVLRIDADAPRSATDRFVLGLARARADALLTSGAILAAEPELRLEIGGTGEERAELQAWRREVMGSTQPLFGGVMTRNANLDLDHPFFEKGERTAIYTTSEAAAALEARAEERGIALLPRATPNAADAIVALREHFGARAVGIELGAGASRPLYGEAPEMPGAAGLDELWLSLYEEPALPRERTSDAFFTLAQLEEMFPASSTPVVSNEESGRWSVRRMRRRGA